MTIPNKTTLGTDGPRRWHRWALTTLVAAFSIGLLSIWLVPGNTPEAENRLPLAWPVFDPSSSIDTTTYRELDAALRDRLGAQAAVSDAIGDLSVHGLGQSPTSKVVIGTDRQPFLAEDLVRPCRETTKTMDAVKLGLERDQAAMVDAGKYVAFIVAPNKSSVHRTVVDAISPDLLTCSDFVRSEILEWKSEGDLPLITLWDEVAARDTGSEPAYLWNDTHWSASGSVALSEVLMQRLVSDQQVSAEILRDFSNPISSAARPFVGDLNYMMGVKDTDYKSTISFDRPDVVTTAEKTVGPEGSTQDHFTSTSTTSALVPGKTLLLGDSFLVREMPSQLSNFFSDLTIANVREYAQLGDYDRVIVERVERSSGTADWPALRSALE